MNMTKLNIEILTNADYLHFGSLKIVGFDNLTFRFDSSGKLLYGELFYTIKVRLNYLNYTSF